MTSSRVVAGEKRSYLTMEAEVLDSSEELSTENSPLQLISDKQSAWINHSEEITDIKM